MVSRHAGPPSSNGPEGVTHDNDSRGPIARVRRQPDRAQRRDGPAAGNLPRHGRARGRRIRRPVLRTGEGGRDREGDRHVRRDGTPSPPGRSERPEEGTTADLVTMDWREWIQDELKGLLREAVKRRLVVTAKPPAGTLPPMTLTVEAIPRESASSATRPSNPEPLTPAMRNSPSRAMPSRARRRPRSDVSQGRDAEDREPPSPP